MGELYDEKMMVCPEGQTVLSKAVLSEGQVLSLCSVTKTVSYNYVHEDVPT